jgi:flagellar operon protein
MITTGVNLNGANIIKPQFSGAQLKPMTQTGAGASINQAQGAGGIINPAAKSFGEVFSEVLARESKLTFSAHAQKRMTSRSIELSAGDYSRLDSAYTRLSQKGAKEALVMLDDKAFLVSVTNKTVITAMDKIEVRQSVFTNIDGAVIA